jgi:hypothetical protein
VKGRVNIGDLEAKDTEPQLDKMYYIGSHFGLAFSIMEMRDTSTATEFHRSSANRPNIKDTDTMATRLHCWVQITFAT